MKTLAMLLLSFSIPACVSSTQLMEDHYSATARGEQALRSQPLQWVVVAHASAHAEAFAEAIRSVTTNASVHVLRASQLKLPDLTSAAGFRARSQGELRQIFEQENWQQNIRSAAQTNEYLRATQSTIVVAVRLGRFKEYEWEHETPQLEHWLVRLEAQLLLPDAADATSPFPTDSAFEYEAKVRPGRSPVGLRREAAIKDTAAAFAEKIRAYVTDTAP